MGDERESDPPDAPQFLRERMDIEIPGDARVAVPLDVVSIRVDDEALAGVVGARYLQHDLQIELVSPGHGESNASPAYVEQFLEVVRTRDARADLRVDRKCVLFSEWHVRFSFCTERVQGKYAKARPQEGEHKSCRLRCA